MLQLGHLQKAGRELLDGVMGVVGVPKPAPSQMEAPETGQLL